MDLLNGFEVACSVQSTRHERKCEVVLVQESDIQSTWLERPRSSLKSFSYHKLISFSFAFPEKNQDADACGVDITGLWALFEMTYDCVDS